MSRDGRPVDIAALRDGASALRALARAHVSLTEPDSRARLAQWLLDEEDSVKKLDPEGSVQLNVRVSASLAAALERERERLAAATPGMEPSTSDVVRVLLARALAPTAGKRKAKGTR